MKVLARGKKLHVGCGDEGLEGWINVDMTPYPAVDHVADVTEELPFRDVPFIFAEHFIEHLSIFQALEFMKRCREALSPDGVLRLTTPNLDWVWLTQYRPDSWEDGEAPLRDCLSLNRSFYGWGHQFLYNRQTLERALRSAGFASVQWCERNESRHEELRGIERHEPYPDAPGTPHILVAEASGVLESPEPFDLSELSDYRRDTEAPYHMLQYAALASVRLIKRLLGR